jgi:hypothetical protein
MPLTDDVRKTLTDPTPLYFVAGTADLAAQRLKEVPTLVEKIVAEAPERIAAVRQTDPKAVQDRVAKQAKDAQDRLAELFGSFDTDLRKVRDTAQELALQGVGRAAELAVRARERYDEVAEHGQEVVRQWRGEEGEQAAGEAAVAVEPEKAGFWTAAGETDVRSAPAAEAVTVAVAEEAAPAGAAEEPQAADDEAPKAAAKPAAKRAAKATQAKKTAPRKSTARKPSATTDKAAASDE